MHQNRALRYARRQRGWSQASLAKRLSTTAQQVSRWERGETHPSPYYCEQLCLLFGQSAEALGLIEPEPQLEKASSPHAVLHDQDPLADTSIVDPILTRLSSAPGLIIDRHQLVAQVLEQLADGATCALSGLPGAGKTTLVQLLVSHPDFATMFPHGYIWVNLGLTPDIYGEFARLASLLGIPAQERLQERSVEGWSRLLHQALGDRRLLIIIDDAWTIEAILPFLVGGQSVAHLVTTRLPQLALSVTASFIRVPEFSHEECLTLLNALVPGLSSVDNSLFDEALSLIGGLPLAVNLCGKYLRMQTAGGQVRRLAAALRRLLVRDTRLQLSVLLSSPTFHSSIDGSMSHSLATAIEISDQQLPQAAQTALRALSVLPPRPHCFSEAAALAVSQGNTTVLDMLLDAGLLESAGEGWYQMHQTIADYACLHCDEPDPMYRLVNYACQLCSSFAFAEPQTLNAMVPTVLAAIEAANIVEQDRHLIQMVLALVPFWHSQRSFEQADSRLRLALNAALREKDQETISLLQAHLDKTAQMRGKQAPTASLENTHPSLFPLHVEAL